MPDTTMTQSTSTTGRSRLRLSPLWLVPVTVISATVMGLSLGRGAVLLTLAGGALLGAIWALWHSLQSLTGDAPLTLEEAVGMGAPSAEEERKAAVLRALKDLEYERQVGKIAEADFQELSQKYRAEAKALLQLLDDDLGPARDRVEQLVRERRQARHSTRSDQTSPSDVSKTPKAETTGAPEPAKDEDDLVDEPVERLEREPLESANSKRATSAEGRAVDD